MTDLTLLNVRPWGGPAVDVALSDGRITHMGPAGEQDAPGGAVVEGEGRLAFPAFSDAHVHLDSTRIGLPFRPHSAEPGPLWNMIANDRAHWREAEASVADRATETLGRAIAHGMTRARSYAQIDADCRLERFEGVRAAREAHRARADVEIVAFPQAGLLLEPGELGLSAIRSVIERVRALDYRGRVTLAHAFCIGDLAEPTRRGVLDDLAELDIALTTIAPGGRTALPLREILDRGIRLGLGQDGQRDYWSPYGNTDMLDRTWILSYTNNLRRDELVEEAIEVATLGGARVIDADLRFDDQRGFAPGDPADLVLVPGETPTSAVMDRPGGRTVVHAGRVVADDGELR